MDKKYRFSTSASAAQKNRQLMRIKSDEEYRQISAKKVNARLYDLHEKISEVQEDNMKNLITIERQRNWMLWHNHSSLSSHAFMLLLMIKLYDPAIHLTSQKYKEQYGREVDIQATTEQPHMYILGKSRATLQDELLFVPTSALTAYQKRY